MDDSHCFEVKNEQLSELIKDRSNFDCLKNQLKGHLSGASGIISKLEDPNKPGQYLCFKSIRTSDDGDDENKSKFQIDLFREIDITHRARHPCTVELINFDLTPKFERPAIVTKFYEHGSLSSCYASKSHPYLKWGKETGLNGTVYTILLYGIARGVRYLHEHKILHRDLKPLNIFIDKYFRPHIGDFGLSKVTYDNDEHSGAYGTCFFMAPEIKKENGKIRYSYPADVFALGIIFYTIASGKDFKPNLDFKKINRQQTKQSQFAEARRQLIELFKNKKTPKLKGSENTKLNELIDRMWAYDENDRPSMNEVCELLEDEKYWFDGTDRELFDKYKKEIDEYEAAQIPIISKLYPFGDKANNDFIEEKIIAKDHENNHKKYIMQLENGHIYSHYSYKEQQMYLESSERGNSEAEFSLGIIFYTGFYGIPKDYVQSLKYLIRSREHGNKIADCVIKTILAEVKQKELKTRNSCSDSKLSIDDEFFKKLKNKSAQLLMGMVYEAFGRKKEALEYYLKSANQGSIRAKGRIGSLLYKNGQMIEQAEDFLRSASGWKCEYKPDKDDPIEIKRTKSDYESDDDDYNDEDETAAENDEKYERDVMLFYLGRLMFDSADQAKLDESIEIFTKLLGDKYNNAHPCAALALALAYKKKGDKENEKKFAEIAYKQFSSFTIQDNTDES